MKQEFYLPADIWKYEIMSFLPKPIKKIPYINDLKLLINNADGIFKTYMLEHQYDMNNEYLAPIETFYEIWKNRQTNYTYINMDIAKLDLLHDEPRHDFIHEIGIETQDEIINEDYEIYNNFCYVLNDLKKNYK